MIDLTRNRRKIFAFTGLFVLLLAAVLLFLPPEISPALGGGVGLEYRIHAVFNDEEEQQLAESSLIQTASDTLGLSVEGSLVPSSAQENLWLLQLRLDPTDEIPYDDFQDLTYALINSFPGWTFQTTAGISQSRGTAVRSTVDYLLCLIVLLGISALYLLLRCSRAPLPPLPECSASCSACWECARSLLWWVWYSTSAPFWQLSRWWSLRSMTSPPSLPPWNGIPLIPPLTGPWLCGPPSRNGAGV